MASDLEYHVRQARNGDKHALERVVVCIQDKIYGLALRMLGNDEDAKDESQEILIKVITHLSEFREESAFSSLGYRVACNHLLTVRKRKNDREGVTFDFLENMMLDDVDKAYPLTVSGPERDLLAEEARLDCIQTVLACLDAKTRMTYILGDIYGITSIEGSYIFDITTKTFRKRLSRGRKRIARFMMKHCGLANENNPCRCHLQAGKKLAFIPANPVSRPVVKRDGVAKGRAEAVAQLKELSEFDRAAAMFRRDPEYRSPESFTHIVKDLIRSGRYSVFRGSKIIFQNASARLAGLTNPADRGCRKILRLVTSEAELELGWILLQDSSITGDFIRNRGHHRKMADAHADVFLRISVKVGHQSPARIGRNGTTETAGITSSENSLLQLNRKMELELVDPSRGEILIHGVNSAAAVRFTIVGQQEGGLVYAVNVGLLRDRLADVHTGGSGQ